MERQISLHKSLYYEQVSIQELLLDRKRNLAGHEKTLHRFVLRLNYVFTKENLRKTDIWKKIIKYLRNQSAEDVLHGNVAHQGCKR